MKILFEDNAIVVCIKPVGMLSQESAEGGESIISLLKQECGSEIYPVHRLDRAVGGLMVFAKTAKAAAELSRQVQERIMQKEYLAVVHGIMEQPQAVLEDILFKDSSKNKSFVVKTMRKGAKKASLEYRLLGTAEETSLVHVLLHTGRTHQIRVQFASRKHPLLGDGKYGGRDHVKAPALWSAGLRFLHPMSKKELYFREIPEKAFPWDRFPLNGYYKDHAMNVSVRAAKVGDETQIAEIYEKIHTEEEQGRASIGWERGVYPTIETAKLGIGSGDMFVAENESGWIVAAARLNHEQCPQYAEAQWEYPAEDREVLVMHTLVVDPEVQGNSVGRKMLEYYESYSESLGCRYLRIDTNERNKIARAFYAKCGYKEVGIVLGEFNGMPDIPLVCMEKKI